MENVKRELINQFNNLFRDETSVKFQYENKTFEVSRTGTKYLLTATSGMVGDLATIVYSKDNAEYLTDWVMYIFKGINE